MFCNTSQRRLRLIALIGGILTLLVVLTAHPGSPFRDDNHIDGPAPRGPAPSPTTGTTTENPKTTNSGKNLLKLRAFVLKNTVTTEQDLLNENSPQSKALKWLFVTDVMQEKAELLDRDTLIRYALGTLYYSTNNVLSNQGGKYREEIWKTETDWLSPNSVCGWFGITCGGSRDDDTEVVGISLAENGLGGTIPKELATLTQLKSLIMHTNGMAGTIPSQFGQLTHLRNLHLSTNSLTGTLPPNLFGVKNSALVEVYLEKCNLTGSLPSELGNLSNLRTYIHHACMFHCFLLCIWLPPEWSLTCTISACLVYFYLLQWA
jgi:Leucine-rich repeat (LRR) protein